MPPEMRLHDIIIPVAVASAVWAPGAAIRTLTRTRSGSDLPSAIALDCTAGLAFWPLAFLLVSSTPWALHSTAITVIVALAAMVAVLPRVVRAPRLPAASEWKTLGLMTLIFGATIVTRLRAARWTALPPWIDSVHHTMLVRLLVEQGRVPESYDPFIAGAPAFYHWGYHAVVAAIAGLLHSRDPFELARIVLQSGQWLNAAATLFVYAAAREWSRSRPAALLAAAVCGLVSYYPAYYLSWGRYTHLAGALLLLGWMTQSLRTIRKPSAGQTALLAIISAGLALVHVRMAFFAAVFAVVILAAGALRSLALRPRGQQGANDQSAWVFLRRSALPMMIAAAIALFLISPWLLRLHRGRVMGAALSPSSGSTSSATAGASWDTPNEARSDLFWVPHNALILSFATAGMSGLANFGALSTAERVASVAWWLIVILLASRLASRRRSRTRSLLLFLGMVAGWSLLIAMLLNASVIGLPRMRLATNDAAIITTFIPLSLAAGACAAWALRAALRPRLRWLALTVCIVAAGAFGLATLSDVLNPGTVIASASDLQALHWIAGSLPPTAVLLGGVQPWYAGTFSGTDGAYWSSVLTGRYSLPPPSLYGWSQPAAVTAPLHKLLGHWKEQYPNVTPALAAEARAAGVTHVYFGEKTAAVRGTPPGRVVYQRDGIAIVQLPAGGVGSQSVRHDFSPQSSSLDRPGLHSVP